jgi:hypothetical protein
MEMALGGLGAFAYLAMSLSLFGGVSPPMGIPPGPEDRVMSRVAPEKCLAYFSWAGMAAPDAKSTNQTEQLLAEPEVQHALAQVKKCFRALLRRSVEKGSPENAAAADDLVALVKVVLTHPGAAFLLDLKLKGDKPHAAFGMIVRTGPEAARIKRAIESLQKRASQGKDALKIETIEIAGQTWHRVPARADTPEVISGFKDDYLILAVGKGTLEGILSRMNREPPAWLSDLRKRLPVARVATTFYFDIQAFLDFALVSAKEGKAEVKMWIDIVGLGNVKSVAEVTGLDGEGYLSRTLLALDGPPRGLLRLASDKPLRPEDLAPIPRDATVAFAFRLDLQDALDVVLDSVNRAKPESRTEMLQAIDGVEKSLGIDLRHGVLGSLGDTWCVYSSPSEGGLVISGLTAVVPIRNYPGVSLAYSKLLGAAKAALAADSPAPSAGEFQPHIEQFPFEGKQIGYVNLMSIAPAWCLTNGQFIMALAPHNIKAYLSRDQGRPSLAAVPQVGQLFSPSSGPIAFAYSDTPKLFELLYPLVSMAASAAVSAMQQAGVECDMSFWPSWPAIARHLHPSVTEIRRTKDGIEMQSHRNLPAMGMGVLAIVGLANSGWSMFEPSLAPPAAVGVSPNADALLVERQFSAMYHLDVVATGMKGYRQAHQATFPPAFSTSKDGKPLLSWRVLILPYAGQESLYKQFHLDEPWDSRHNKKLLTQMPEFYKTIGNNVANTTTTLVVRGAKTVFPGGKAVGEAEVKDGLENTVMVVEVQPAGAVPWTKPDDFQYDQENPTAGLTAVAPFGPGVLFALFCDGTVRWLSNTTDNAAISALFTHAGGEKVDLKMLPAVEAVSGVSTPPGLGAPAVPVPTSSGGTYGSPIGAGLGALHGEALGPPHDTFADRAAVEKESGFAAAAMTVENVIDMTQAKVDDQLIIAHIRWQRVVAMPSASDLIRLKQKGVSARVITIMQESARLQSHAVPASAAPAAYHRPYEGGTYGSPAGYDTSLPPVGTFPVPGEKLSEAPAWVPPAISAADSKEPAGAKR